MPETRRQLYRRRRIAVFGGLALVLLLAGGGVYAGITLTAPLPAATASVVQPPPLTQPAAALGWPGYGRGAVGAVGFGGVLGTGGEQTPAPMASITKVVTALVVLQAKPIADGEGPTITFTDHDVDLYYEGVADNASVAPVREGLQLTEKQALTMMLLPSAANYSISLAEWAYGSVDAYLTAANAWLAANGMPDTKVVDTSGLDDGSAGAPADLVQLAKLAVADPVVSAIVAQPTAEIPGIGTVENTNKMLGRNGVDGIKTGTNDNAGACLLFSADYTVGSHTVTVVGVMLGGIEMPDHGELDRGISALLDTVVPGFHEVTLATKGELFGSFRTVWGQKATAVAAEDASALVWSDTAITAAPSVDTLVTAASGSTVGAVRFSVGDKTVEVPLVLKGRLVDPGGEWRLTHPGELAAAG